MAKVKGILRCLLYPPVAIALPLIPAAIAALVYSIVVLGTNSPFSIPAYVLSAYTLTIWCCRIPAIFRWVRRLRAENPLILRWRSDLAFQVNITLLFGCLWNLAYCGFQLCLGLYHHSFWYGSLAAYYFLLGIMRLMLVRYTLRQLPGTNRKAEWKRYGACGRILLLMNLALSVMVFFMVYRGRTFRHHQITTIAMATYTFTSFTMAIIGLVRKRRLGSPVVFASKVISLASACVSMLTLTTTMLTAFGSGDDTSFHRLMQALVGSAVCIFITIMAVYMLRRAKNIKE